MRKRRHFDSNWSPSHMASAGMPRGAHISTHAVKLLLPVDARMREHAASQNRLTWYAPRLSPICIPRCPTLAAHLPGCIQAAYMPTFHLGGAPLRSAHSPPTSYVAARVQTRTRRRFGSNSCAPHTPIAQRSTLRSRSLTWTLRYLSLLGIQWKVRAPGWPAQSCCFVDVHFA